MYINLAHAIWNARGGAPLDAMNLVLTELTAEQLASYTNRVWERPRVAIRNLIPGSSVLENALHQNWSVDLDPDALANGVVPQPPPNGYFRHIVYAYLLEATNIETVFRRVVHDWLNGERLPFPTLQSHVWLRNTEQLFFTNPMPPGIRSLTSDIRPDRAAIRRNAYYRLLGFDLPQTGTDGRTSAFVKPDTANRDFLRAWEQLLRETWDAFANRNNLVGVNRTDESAMVELVREIHDMLTARRMNGTLSREEFDAVTHFDWFHLAVLNNTAVVQNLSAVSTSPAMRLKKIADAVGVPVHTKADSFFQIAVPMAQILELIETGAINVNNVNQLYQGNGVIARGMRLIWTHWSLATGREVKGVDLRGLPTTRTQPVSVPATASPMMAQTSRFQPVTVSR